MRAEPTESHLIEKIADFAWNSIDPIEGDEMKEHEFGSVDWTVAV